MKLFYTAITRCRRKLFLSDSGEAGDAVLTRWLKEKAALVEEYKINDEVCLQTQSSRDRLISETQKHERPKWHTQLRVTCRDVKIKQLRQSNRES